MFSYENETFTNLFEKSDKVPALCCFSYFIYLCPALAQERKVTGTVTSADDNSPMPGVNVVVQGKTTGTITDVNGSFSITVPGNDAVLVFSFIGYNAQEVAVGGQSVH